MHTDDTITFFVPAAVNLIVLLHCEISLYFFLCVCVCVHAHSKLVQVDICGTVVWVCCVFVSVIEINLET